MNSRTSSPPPGAAAPACRAARLTPACIRSISRRTGSISTPPAWAATSMGPWYLNAAKTNLFPNYPSNTAAMFRFPRVPAIPATQDALRRRHASATSWMASRCSTSATPSTGTARADDVSGSGHTGTATPIVNESVTFDNAGAHQAGNNHHYHAQPRRCATCSATMWTTTAATNTYTESTAPPAAFAHRRLGARRPAGLRTVWLQRSARMRAAACGG